jgi:hypothetical protein
VSDILFAPAAREQAKARIALCGPSGSGKTWTGLMIATRLADRVAVIDTEHRSASKYAGDPFTFDTFSPTRYDPRDLVKALAAAGQAGYGALMVDSLTHYWSGPGGVLELVDEAGKRNRGNSFAGWRDVRPYERAMVEAMLGYPGHVIVTMRTKTEYVVEDSDNGKKAPRKVGLRPEQRDGIEFEFDIVGDMDQDNTLVITKSRCSELSGVVKRKPDEELPATIAAWLGTGERMPDAKQYRDQVLDPGTSFEDLGGIRNEVIRRGLAEVNVINDSGDVEPLLDLIYRIGKERKPA